MEGLRSVTTTFAVTRQRSTSIGKAQYQSITPTQKSYGFTLLSRNHNGNPYGTLSLSRTGTDALSSCRPTPNFTEICTSTTVRAHSTTRSSTGETTSPHLSVSENRHWMVLMQRPSEEVAQSDEKISSYYVVGLQRVFESDVEAQSCIYDFCCNGTQFGFCCDIDEDTARALAGLPEVLLVKPDPDRNSTLKDYSSELESSREPHGGAQLLFPAGSTKHWLVRTDKQMIRADTKADLVDYYTRILSKVLGNERDAQMCIYHVSSQSDYGFCCELDEECAKELASVPGVLSVQPDDNFDSENKDYRGDSLLTSTSSLDPLNSAETTRVSTKKLFITGLSFYTSEKTLRAAFESFGELVEVKVIMDKISKRSKGYAFVEYTTEEAASKALKEMNGKIINGWMIVVDVAKSKPRDSRGPPNPRY